MSGGRNDPPTAHTKPPQALADEGACRGTDPEAFFPTTPGGLKAAIKICNGCPVRQACLDWALETRQAHGVLGGMGPEERIEITRRTTA